MLINGVEGGKEGGCVYVEDLRLHEGGWADGAASPV